MQENNYSSTERTLDISQSVLFSDQNISISVQFTNIGKVGAENRYIITPSTTYRWKAEKIDDGSIFEKLYVTFEGPNQPAATYEMSDLLYVVGSSDDVQVSEQRDTGGTRGTKRFIFTLLDDVGYRDIIQFELLYLYEEFAAIPISQSEFGDLFPSSEVEENQNELIIEPEEPLILINEDDQNQGEVEPNLIDNQTLVQLDQERINFREEEEPDLIDDETLAQIDQERIDFGDANLQGIVNFGEELPEEEIQQQAEFPEQQIQQQAELPEEQLEQQEIVDDGQNKITKVLCIGGKNRIDFNGSREFLNGRRGDMTPWQDGRPLDEYWSNLVRYKQQTEEYRAGRGGQKPKAPLLPTMYYITEEGKRIDLKRYQKEQCLGIIPDVSGLLAGTERRTLNISGDKTVNYKDKRAKETASAIGCYVGGLQAEDNAPFRSFRSVSGQPLAPPGVNNEVCVVQKGRGRTDAATEFFQNLRRGESSNTFQYSFFEYFDGLQQQNPSAQAQNYNSLQRTQLIRQLVDGDYIRYFFRKTELNQNDTTYAKQKFVPSVNTQDLFDDMDLGNNVLQPLNAYVKEVFFLSPMRRGNIARLNPLAVVGTLSREINQVLENPNEVQKNWLENNQNNQ